MFKWFGGKKTAEAEKQTKQQIEKPAVQEPVVPFSDRVTQAEPTSPTFEAVEQQANDLNSTPTIQSQETNEGAFARLRAAASVTGKSLIGKIRGLIRESEIDDEAIDEIEELLIRADVGLSTATRITDKLRKQKHEFNTVEKLILFLKKEFEDILTPYENANHLDYKPGVMNIYLVVGVNGAGKTTFIGKLANQYIRKGKKVMIGAGDTFRAAAEEQLEIWAQRAGAGFVGAGNATDPAAVIFDALRQAKENGVDVVLLDTAGRLQNKFNLMEELRKVLKVIQQEMPLGSHFESLLILDATTGQNALKQASVFKEVVDISGVVLTKLDSSAKGGVILTIAEEYHLPVKMVGVGEGIEDLKEFNAREFVDALFQR